MQREITLDGARALIQEHRVDRENLSKGPIFYVKFIKRGTGEIREMRCRFGVKKGVKGVGMAYNCRDGYDLENVYDLTIDKETSQVKGWRMINLRGLLELSLNGIRYIIQDDLKRARLVGRLEP